MSKTDKDRPYRLRAFFEGVEYHDHRRGECIMETFEQVRAGRFMYGHNHSRVCKKWHRVESDCPGRINCWRARSEYNTKLAILRTNQYSDFYTRGMLNRPIWTRPENYTCANHFTNVYTADTLCVSTSVTVESSTPRSTTPLESTTRTVTRSPIHSRSTVREAPVGTTGRNEDTNTLYKSRSTW